MGITGNMLKFVENYIKDRLIRVRIGNEYSTPKHTKTGTPQGGVLSATCFIVAINNILENLSPNVQGSLYADDLIIYCTTSTPTVAERLLQRETDKIIEWTKRTGLHLSPSKSEAIIFEKCKIRGKRRRTDPKGILIENTLIPYKESIRFLGLILDKRLNWTKHLTDLKAKTQRSLNLLRVLSKLSYGPDRPTLLRLYWAVCQTKMDYGAQLYSSASPNILKMLDPVHNEAMRLCSGAFRTSPTSSLMVELNQPPLDLHREELCLKYMYRIKTNEDYKNLNIMNEEYDLEYFIKDNIPKPIGVRFRNLEQDVTPIEEEITPIASPMQTKQLSFPPWKLDNINMCFEGINNSKSSSSSLVIQQEFRNHLYKHYKSNYCYTDGSKTQNKVGYAAVFGHKKIKRALPKEASIFTAELMAIRDALEEIEQLTDEYWTIYSDSMAALLAVKKYNPKHPIVQAIQEILQRTSKMKKIVFCKVPSHVNIYGNEEADKAAKEASQLEPIINNIPHTDLNRYIKQHIKSEWQLLWDSSSSKLRNIKPNIETWPNYPNRRESIIMTRLRIGHTRLTHSYYITRGRPPECCNTRLTIEHLFLRCRRYANLRRKHNLPKDMKSLLGPNSPKDEIILFLKDAKILEEI